MTTPEAKLHVASSDNQSKKKKNNKKEELLDWIKKIRFNKKGECQLVPEVQLNSNENVSPIEIYSVVTSLKEQLELIVKQSNRYANQNGRNFSVNKEELKAFLGINLAINKLPTIAEHWRVDNLIGSDSIQNTNSFCEIHQNLYCADNRKNDKTGQGFKMRPVM